MWLFPVLVGLLALAVRYYHRGAPVADTRPGSERPLMDVILWAACGHTSPLNPHGSATCVRQALCPGCGDKLRRKARHDAALLEFAGGRYDPARAQVIFADGRVENDTHIALDRVRNRAFVAWRENTNTT